VTEHKLFTGDIPHVSTAAFHADRERAPHLEQPAHWARLQRARLFVGDASRALLDAGHTTLVSVSDLGCGDGGLLQLLTDLPDVTGWG
jgi:hypothetical protein